MSSVVQDLYYFYYQAALYGFYRNFTESGGGMELDGFYDVTVPGAEVCECVTAL